MFSNQKQYQKQSQNQFYNGNSNNGKNIVCNNCMKMGHYHHQCRLPIISYGIILFRMKKHTDNDDDDTCKNQITTITKTPFEYLMICRKNTFGYIDFVRGNYSINNTIQIQIIIDEMTNDEKEQIRTVFFN